MKYYARRLGSSAADRGQQRQTREHSQHEQSRHGVLLFCMGAELGVPVLVAAFYLPLLYITCTDGAFSDRAFNAGAFIT